MSKYFYLLRDHGLDNMIQRRSGFTLCHKEGNEMKTDSLID